VKPAASGDRHSCVVESIADREHCQFAVVRCEQIDAAQDGGMQRTDAHRKLQARK
jgi:hypothetical protein